MKICCSFDWDSLWFLYKCSVNSEFPKQSLYSRCKSPPTTVNCDLGLRDKELLVLTVLLGGVNFQKKRAQNENKRAAAILQMLETHE